MSGYEVAILRMSTREGLFFGIPTAYKAMESGLGLGLGLGLSGEGLDDPGELPDGLGLLLEPGEGELETPGEGELLDPEGLGLEPGLEGLEPVLPEGVDPEPEGLSGVVEPPGRRGPEPA